MRTAAAHRTGRHGDLVEVFLAQLSETASGSAEPRGRRGLGAALVTGLVVAYPLMWAASLTHAAFSDCWISCGEEPSPAWGVVWSLVSAVLLGAPIVLGLRVARVRSRAAWAAGFLLVLLLVTAWAIFSLDPDNAELFVKLGE
jgi:hypothetical protein